MQRTRIWFGVLSIAVPIAFVACSDEPEDGGSASAGGTSGRGGSTGGTATGGRGGSNGGASGTSTGGTAPAGMGGEGGEAGAEGGEGGEAGGVGGEGGEAGTTQGGSSGSGGAGGMMIAGGGAGGAVAGGGAGGKAGGGGAGGAGGANAGAGGANAGAGGANAGAGGAVAGGGAGGAAGMAGGGMAGGAGFPTVCDPTPPPKAFVAELAGTKENPPNNSFALGWAIAELNAAETHVTASAYGQYLSTNPTAAHIHGPAPADMNGGIQFDLGSTPANTTGGTAAQTFPINATQLADLKNGLYYANVHSTRFADGELRGHFVPALVFRSGPLSGLQEVPPTASTATGRVVVVVFPSIGLFPNVGVVSATWSGLSSNTANVRLYSPAGFGFITGNVLDLEAPTNATSGTVVQKLWPFAGGDEGNLIINNDTYAEVRSVNYPYGEIRAQLLPPCP